jgi:hypothetical protein
MLADLDLLLTAVFCTADDLLPERAKNARRRVTDAEVVTLAVAQALAGLLGVSVRTEGSKRGRLLVAPVRRPPALGAGRFERHMDVENAPDPARRPQRAATGPDPATKWRRRSERDRAVAVSRQPRVR